jgi:two-component system sensor histidine kinase/response regulator
MNTNSTYNSKLLIVDDEPAQMRAMCDTLQLEGYVVTGFTSAKQALQAMREERFDLAITDLTMPEMDGIAFLKAARELDPQLIGIVTTGHGSIDTAVAAMKAGAFDYVLKPFTLRTMLPALERALSVRHLLNENFQLRQTEEMIRNLNASLERAVEDRTRQLTDANKELEAFAHSISHDLRGPLRAINNFAHLLGEECREQMNERARGYLHRVLSSAARMEQLIEDLMRLSRVNGADLRRTTINVSRMVASIIAELQSRDPERHVETTIGEDLFAQADPQLLRIALENLIGNAWKFTRNAPEPRIEFGVSDPQKSVFYVRDNGAGFNPQYAKDLFAPFKRLHSSDEFPGSGIGLSIVQRVIRRHGGCIEAESSEGHGATFYFQIPEPVEIDQEGMRN